MDTFFEEVAELNGLMRSTLERWALREVKWPSLTNQMALADGLVDEYLIDHDTSDALQELSKWIAVAEDGSASYSQSLQVHALLDELVELFEQLANAPTLGKRHEQIISRWMLGDSINELAYSRGADEQRILVLLHEVVRYYEVESLEALKIFLEGRVGEL
jgi:transcriptional regulator with XRE-family HTH domain